MSDRRPSQTVAVVGGGIVGIATAYHLAGDPETTVRVLEAERVAGGATAIGLGGIRTQFSSRLLSAIMRHSVAAFDEYERSSSRIESTDNGYLFLASDADGAAGLAADAAMHRSLGIDVETLDADGVEKRVPYLASDDLTRGTFGPDGRLTDQYAVTRWLADEFEAAGGRLHEETPVTGLRIDEENGTGITGVETPSGVVNCDAVVNAAGVRAPSIAAMAGVSLPVTPQRIQAVTVEDCPGVTASDPFVVDLDARRYFCPDGDDALIVGGQRPPDEGGIDPDHYDESPDRAFEAEAVEFLLDRTRGFEDATVTGGWTGLKGVTPDGRPVAGEHDAVPGLYTAAGFDGYGFMMAPAVGIALASRLRTGEWPAVSLDPLSPDRFGEADGVETSDGFMNVSEDPSDR